MWIRNGLQKRHERLLRLEKTVRERDFELTEEQILALERFDPEYRERHIEVKKTGELVAVDTFFAGTLKGVGKVYIQTVLDCFSRYVWARLYTSKMPVTAVQILNNHARPIFEEHGVKIETILGDNGREYCGREDRHAYELFLQLEELPSTEISWVVHICKSFRMSRGSVKPGRIANVLRVTDFIDMTCLSTKVL